MTPRQAHSVTGVRWLKHKKPAPQIGGKTGPNLPKEGLWEEREEWASAGRCQGGGQSTEASASQACAVPGMNRGWAGHALGEPSVLIWWLRWRKLSGARSLIWFIVSQARGLVYAIEALSRLAQGVEMTPGMVRSNSQHSTVQDHSLRL